MTNLSTPIDYFKNQSKQLFRQVQANDAEALARVRRVLKDPKDISLMRVQHVVAIEHGFLKWEDLLKASGVELQAAIATKQGSGNRPKVFPNRTGTPLGNFLRGPGIIQTPPLLAVPAETFDMMTMEEQRRYLDENARAMGSI